MASADIWEVDVGRCQDHRRWALDLGLALSYSSLITGYCLSILDVGRWTLDHGLLCVLCGLTSGARPDATNGLRTENFLFPVSSAIIAPACAGTAGRS